MATPLGLGAIPGSWFVEAAPAEPAESSASFERLYRAFLAARAALGLALIAAQLIAAVLSTPPATSTLWLSASYAAAAVSLSRYAIACCEHPQPMVYVVLYERDSLKKLPSSLGKLAKIVGI